MTILATKWCSTKCKLSDKNFSQINIENGFGNCCLCIGNSYTYDLGFEAPHWV